MTRKSKRRNNALKSTKQFRKRGLDGNNYCVSFVKAGRFHSRDTGDFGNRSEGDVGEFNLEHSNVLSYQSPDSHSCDEDIVLYQGRRFVHDHQRVLSNEQLKIGAYHLSELLPPGSEKHFSPDTCCHDFEEKDVFSKTNSIKSGGTTNDEKTAIDDYIENLREFNEPTLSELLLVPENKELALKPEVVDNQVERSSDKKLIDNTYPASYEYDIGSITNNNCAQNVGYKNMDVSMYDLSKGDVLSHEHINESNATHIIHDDNNKENCSDNYDTSFVEEVCNRRLSSSIKSLPKSPNMKGRSKRNQSKTEDWSLGDLTDPAEKPLSAREELVDNDGISFSDELDYIDRKFDELDVVDPDLEALLYSQWRLDRNKKARRKKEREELRVMGMLGGKQKMKYKESSNFIKQDLKREMQLFLSCNQESNSFPPLGRAERKFVHELAHAFGLRSRSIGKGILRHPVIYKTATSMRCFDEEVEHRSAGLHRVSRSYVPKERINGDRNRSYRRKGGSDRFAVGYREGEIVGAAAPELAAENVGNQLMRKLGWKPGEALGAQNNKGILQPVAHVVKNTRTGLG